ncbi:MAG: hypothetical protein JWP81_4553 [Ferruginibacter sp.]|nr:hypothetical protein [Ferruginibacter sp.]
MKIFSRIAFICNISFLVFIVLAYIELGSKKKGVPGAIRPLPFITGLLVILGQLAIFINLAFCLICLAMLLSKRMKTVPQWLVIVNFILLLVQVYYFFI